MNEDTLEIMQAIGNMHADLKEDIGNAKSSIAGLDGRLTATLTATNERVDKVEEEQQRTDTRQWWHSGLILPLNLAIHFVIKKFGGDI